MSSVVVEELRLLRADIKESSDAKIKKMADYLDKKNELLREQNEILKKLVEK